MVMPRSRSISMESSTCSFISRKERPPVAWIRRSASVDFPWSIWAMIEKFRMCARSVMNPVLARRLRPRGSYRRRLFGINLKVGRLRTAIALIGRTPAGTQRLSADLDGPRHPGQRLCLLHGEANFRAQRPHLGGAAAVFDRVAIAGLPAPPAADAHIGIRLHKTGGRGPPGFRLAVRAAHAASLSSSEAASLSASKRSREIEELRLFASSKMRLIVVSSSGLSLLHSALMIRSIFSLTLALASSPVADFTASSRAFRAAFSAG